MSEAERESGVLTLGGRRFEPAQNINFEHQAWMMAHVYAAGLDDPSENVRDFLGKVLSSGRLLKLLAGSLDELGVEWTPEEAEKNAVFFGKITDPREMQALHASIAGVLGSFFLRPGISFATSPSYSTESSDAEAITGSGAQSNSDNSLASSESSQDTTQPESARS